MPQPPILQEARDACELMSDKAKDAERQRRLREWRARNPSAPLLDVLLCLRADLPRILLRQLTPEGADPLTGARELGGSRALDGPGLPLLVEVRLLAALDCRPHRFGVRRDWHEDEDQHDPPGGQPVALDSAPSTTARAKDSPPGTMGRNPPRSRSRT